MTTDPREDLFDSAWGRRWAAISHVVPFVVWLGLLSLLGWLAPDQPWTYAARTLTCLVLVLVLRPWRWYGPLLRCNLLPAALTGVGVFVLWVLPESALADTAPALRDLYLRFGVRPFGKLPAGDGGLIYAPEHCGWVLALIRLGGSAFVIAAIEEFFWRGFLYRWLLGNPFIKVKLDEWDWERFLIVAAVFGLEHHRWLVGIGAGLAYGLLTVKTKDLWAACLAHVITNFMLGIYVLATGSYAFW